MAADLLQSCFPRLEGAAPGPPLEGPMAQKVPPLLPPAPLRPFLLQTAVQKLAGAAAAPTQCACAPLATGGTGGGRGGGPQG